jgi:hypothetical protein
MGHSVAEGSPGDIDVALQALATRERRTVIACFIEIGGGAIHLKDLIEYVAAKMKDSEVGSTVLVLIHRDLPHLEAAGLIEVDLRSETVVGTDTIHSLKPLLIAAWRVEYRMEP